MTDNESETHEPEHAEPEVRREPEHHDSERRESDNHGERLSTLEQTVATLQGTVDGLLAVVSSAKNDAHDSTPVKPPWTHRGHRTEHSE